MLQEAACQSVYQVFADNTENGVTENIAYSGAGGPERQEKRKSMND